MVTVSDIVSFRPGSNAEDLNELIHDVFSKSREAIRDAELHYLTTLFDTHFYFIGEYHNPLKGELEYVLNRKGYEQDFITTLLSNCKWDEQDCLVK